MQKNIETFNRGATLIFGKLYASFPTPIMINVGHLDPDTSLEEVEVYGHTLRFLEREGFLRWSDCKGKFPVAVNVVLITKGLAVLNSIPESIKQKQTLGEFIVELAKSGAKEAMSKAISLVIGGAISSIS